MKDDILTTPNFEALMAWIEGRDANEPEGAGMFVSKLNERYITKRLSDGDNPPSAARPRTGSRLSLKSIAASDYLDEIEKGKEAIKKLNVVSAMGNNSDDDDLPPAEPQRTEREKALALPRTEDGFIKGDVDTVKLASAITCIWSRMDKELTKERPASVNLVMLTMYICYGCSLAQRLTRLTDDHPQMWKYGVAFPKAYNKAKKWEENAAANAEELLQNNPDVYHLIENVLARIAEKGISKTSDRQRMKGTPWEQTYRLHKDEWSTPIPDKTIEEWFKENLSKNKVF